MQLSYLIKRNMKLFFKDKGMVISSLITPMILILLYVTFLKNIYIDTFNQAISQNNITIDEKYVNGFVYGWLFSSLLAVSCVTVSFCSNLLMVQDKVTGAIFDIQIAPVKKTKIAIAYYVASMLVTMLIILAEIIVGFIFLGIDGWFLTFSDVIAIIFSSFLLVNFGTALSSIIHHFLKTQGQMSAVGTLISSVYGFICGAYMPISQFGSGLQKVLSFLPGTYATTVIRYNYEAKVLEALKNECHLPTEVVEVMSKNFDINIYFYDNLVSPLACYVILISSVLVFLGIYILINFSRNKKQTKLI